MAEDRKRNCESDVNAGRPPSENIAEFWPQNIFIPRSVTRAMPNNPLTRDILFLFSASAVFGLAGYALNFFSEVLGAIIFGLPTMVLIANLSLSLNRAYIAQANARTKYLYPERFGESK